MLRQNEQHEQIEIMANHGAFCKRIKMIKKKSVYKAGKEYENKKVYLNWPNLNSDNKAIRYSG